MLKNSRLRIYFWIISYCLSKIVKLKYLDQKAFASKFTHQDEYIHNKKFDQGKLIYSFSLINSDSIEFFHG